MTHVYHNFQSVFRCSWRGALRHWTHLTFGMVWLVTAIVFICLAVGAYQSEGTTLARFAFRIPHELNLSMNGVNFQDVINGIAEIQEQNASALESSIRQSSHTLLILDVVSAVASFAGFAAQVGAFRMRKRAA